MEIENEIFHSLTFYSYRMKSNDGFKETFQRQWWPPLSIHCRFLQTKNPMVRNSSGEHDTITRPTLKPKAIYGFRISCMFVDGKNWNRTSTIWWTARRLSRLRNGKHFSKCHYVTHIVTHLSKRCMTSQCSWQTHIARLLHFFFVCQLEFYITWFFLHVSFFFWIGDVHISN